MAESIHVDDINTVLYIDVTNEGVSLSTTLDSFTTRTVRLKRPITSGLITITAVPTEADAGDSGKKKLKLLTGTNTSTSLSGTGGFKVPSTDPGDWIGEVFLADASGQWTSDSFTAFTLKANLSA
jgi:hypothetical protein